MDILIAGGSGFLGQALIARLRSDGHRVRVLTRQPRPGQPDDVAWKPDGTVGPWSAALMAPTRSSIWRARASPIGAGTSSASTTCTRAACCPRAASCRDRASREAAGRVRQRIGGRILRRARRRDRHRGDPAGARTFSPDAVRGLGARSRAGVRRHARRHRPHRTGAGQRTGGAARPDAAAVPARRWRTPRRRPPVHAVDPPSTTGSDWCAG